MLHVFSAVIHLALMVGIYCGICGGSESGEIHAIKRDLCLMDNPYNSTNHDNDWQKSSELYYRNYSTILRTSGVYIEKAHMHTNVVTNPLP